MTRRLRRHAQSTANILSNRKRANGAACALACELSRATRYRRRWCVALALCSSGCGPNFAWPQILHPGPAAYQVKDATVFDPYPYAEDMPGINQVRPPGFMQPVPENKRARNTPRELITTRPSLPNYQTGAPAPFNAGQYFTAPPSYPACRHTERRPTPTKISPLLTVIRARPPHPRISEAHQRHRLTRRAHPPRCLILQARQRLHRRSASIDRRIIQLPVSARPQQDKIRSLRERLGEDAPSKTQRWWLTVPTVGYNRGMRFSLKQAVIGIAAIAVLLCQQPLCFRGCDDGQLYFSPGFYKVARIEIVLLAAFVLFKSAAWTLRRLANR